MKVLGLALLCVACSTAPSTDNHLASKPVAELAIELRHGLPTVDVLVSGQPLKLFLDLGGFQAISLTGPELSRVNVRFLATSMQHRNASGTVFESKLFVVPDVVMGGVSFGDLDGGEFVFDQASGPPEKNGYIGMRLLGKYLLVLDYPASRVRLYRSGDNVAFESECGQDVFPVSIVNEVAQSVVSTEYGNLLFEWDTGSTHNVIRPSAMARGAEADHRVDNGPPVTTLRSLRLGGRELGPSEFRVIPFEAPAVEAVFGTTLFASHKVCLDVPLQRGAIV